VAERPFLLNADLGMWVAASADSVDAVLGDASLLVRPPTSPVPNHIEGSPAGTIFSRLVRMNDGAFHAGAKLAVMHALGRIDAGYLAETAGRLATPILSAGGEVDLRRLAFEVPISAMALVIGVPCSEIRRIAHSVAAFVGCVAAGATSQAIEGAIHAAGDLIGLFEPIASKVASDPLHELALRCPMADDDPLVVVANAVGILMQTLEATAGLIGNALVAMSRNAGLVTAVRDSDGTAAAVVREVLRHDAPIQNTRRFVAAPTAVAGVDLVPGDAILVVLAAANRDPSVNPDPHGFRLDRIAPRLFSFGEGPHQCPGETLAVAIATRILHDLSRANLDLASLCGPVLYHPLPNARIPDLGTMAGQRCMQ
jgi:cytochrome P450